MTKLMVFNIALVMIAVFAPDFLIFTGGMAIALIPLINIGANELAKARGEK